jgi:hypothetical protein
MKLMTLAAPPHPAFPITLSWNIGTLEQNRVFTLQIIDLRCSNQRIHLEQMEQTSWNKFFPLLVDRQKF